MSHRVPPTYLPPQFMGSALNQPAKAPGRVPNSRHRASAIEFGFLEYRDRGNRLHHNERDQSVRTLLIFGIRRIDRDHLVPDPFSLGVGGLAPCGAEGL